MLVAQVEDCGRLQAMRRQLGLDYELVRLMPGRAEWRDPDCAKALAKLSGVRVDDSCKFADRASLEKALQSWRKRHGRRRALTRWREPNANFFRLRSKRQNRQAGRRWPPESWRCFRSKASAACRGVAAFGFVETGGIQPRQPGQAGRRQTLAAARASMARQICAWVSKDDPVWNLFLYTKLALSRLEKLVMHCWTRCRPRLCACCPPKPRHQRHRWR